MENIFVKAKLISLSVLVVCAILALTAAPVYGKAVGTVIQPPQQQQTNNPGTEYKQTNVPEFQYLEGDVVFDQFAGNEQSANTVPGVPEPTTLILFGAGLVGLAIKKRRNN